MRYKIGMVALAVIQMALFGLDLTLLSQLGWPGLLGEWLAGLGLSVLGVIVSIGGAITVVRAIEGPPPEEIAKYWAVRWWYTLDIPGLVVMGLCKRENLWKTLTSLDDPETYKNERVDGLMCSVSLGLVGLAGVTLYPRFMGWLFQSKEAQDLSAAYAVVVFLVWLVTAIVSIWRDPRLD